MTIHAWVRDDESDGHSVARVGRSDSGWTAHGAETLVGDDSLAVWFRVDLDDDWRTREVEVLAFDVTGERRTRLTCDGAGVWTVDGRPAPHLDGAVDVDVAATPLTNTFPIRRLADLDVGESSTSPVAWVEVPSLVVHLVDQTYRRLAADRWEYSDPDHGAFELTVDDDGVVIDYAGFARRVRRPDFL